MTRSYKKIKDYSKEQLEAFFNEGKNINLIQNGPLYPVLYEGKLLYEKDCHSLYTSNYHIRYMLLADAGVVVSSDGMYVTPDGEIDKL